MPKELCICVRDLLAGLSTVDGTELPYEVRRNLEPLLSYQHKTHAFGADAYRAGRFSAFQWQKLRLYTYDKDGRMVFQKGWIPRIQRVLSRLGYSLRLVNNNPAPARPRRYEMDWDRVLRHFSFRPKQDECLVRIAANPSGVIEAVTAFGKSHIIAMVCALFPYARIDVVTRRRAVAKHLHNLITRAVPNVGLITGTRRQSGRVTVCTEGSLQHSDMAADIVMVDEVHEMMTDRAYRRLSHYGDARLYGFTATKETRADNAHARMTGLFGETIFKMDYREAERLGLVVPIVVQWLRVNLPVDPAAGARSRLDRLRAGVWANDARNRILAEFVQQLYADGKQVLVFVETAEHAYRLRKYLPEFAVCHSEAVFSSALGQRQKAQLLAEGLLRPGELEAYSSGKREQLRQQFERREILGAIATGVWSVGVSFDSLEVLVRADAQASATAAIQIPGRVCRIDPVREKRAGIVIDCLDTFNPVLRRASGTRRRIYAENGWTQLNPDGSVYVPRATRRRPGGPAEFSGA